MKARSGLYLSVAAIALAVVLSGPASAPLHAQQNAVAIDSDDIGGIVTSAKGPEAGVWVIAETRDLPTRYAKMVVTDDQGRYVVPDLPKAKYKVWVRGYGLIDSPKVQSTPGRMLNLTASVAPDARAAAQYYPAGYWASIIRVPDKTEFPGTGPQGNGISPDMKTQAEWLAWLKNRSCYTCHQLGNKATREIPKQFGAFASSRDAWMRRIQSGQA
ncbi:MAG: carboxypeptidase-like regulatory domain-containing protein, partial [Xanthobacteraceae bacterium]